jgi:hypothetical protein
MNRRHKDLASDIRALGSFWGTMRDIMKRKPLMRIVEALGEGDLSKCRQNKCGHFFATGDSLRRHFSHAHASSTMQKWNAKMRQRGDGHKRTTQGKKKLNHDIGRDQILARHQSHRSRRKPRR